MVSKVDSLVAVVAMVDFKPGSCLLSLTETEVGNGGGGAGACAVVQVPHES